MEDGARGLISIPKSWVGIIIGQATGKILYMGVRNKYCSMCAIIEDSSSRAAEQDGNDESNEFGEPEAGDLVLVSSSAHDTCFAHTLQLVVKDGLKEMGAIKRVHSKLATIVSQSSLDRRMSKYE